MKPSEILETVAAGAAADQRQRDIENCIKAIERHKQWNDDHFSLMSFAGGWFWPDQVPEEIENYIYGKDGR